MSDDSTRPQFQPPVFQPPPMPQSGGPAFGVPPSEPTQVMVASSSGGRKRSKGKVIGAAVAALAIIAAGVFAVTKISNNSTKGGAASATDAGEQFTKALNDEDVLGVVDLLLPGERETFRQPLLDMVSNLKRINVLDNSADPKKVGGLDINLADVKVVADQPVAPDIDTVRITARNESSFNGAQLPIGSLLVQEAFGGSKPDQTAKAGGDAVDWKVTTVEKSGRWYVSLFYSIAESVRLSSAASDPVPSTPVPLVGTDKPEDAVDQMAKAAIALDVEKIIGGLNPNEFEAFQRYAPIFLDRAVNRADKLGLKAVLTDAKYGVTGSGTHRSVSIQAFTMQVTGSGDNQQAKIVLANGCLTVDSADKHFDSCTATADIDKSLTQLGVSDNPDLKAFITSITDAFSDFKSTGIAVDQVDGKWYVSPIGTTTDFLNAVLSSLDKNEITDIIDKGKALAGDVGNGTVTLPGLGQTSCSATNDTTGTSVKCTTSTGSTTGDTTATGDTAVPDTVPTVDTDSSPTVTIGTGPRIPPDGFRSDTEKFIEGAIVSEQVGTQFSNAACETPSSTAVGTTYTCTADDPDGNTYTFSVRIDSPKTFIIDKVVPA